MLAVAIILLLFVGISLGAENKECSISVPGYFYRDECKLLCRPASWTDLVVFFLGNYAAHVATINSRPGESTLITVYMSISTFFFPGVGIYRAITAISSLATFAPTELQRAARAGALCMVVKNWPGTADTIWTLIAEFREGDNESDAEENVETRGQRFRAVKERRKFASINIHGLCRLPEGYSLIVLPRYAKFEIDSEEKSSLSATFRPAIRSHTSISCNYNIVKIVIAIGQLGFATSTLYRTRGDQIAVYGFAAFGLTVVQYAWMSLLNLTGSLFCPEYKSMFLVESQSLTSLKEELKAQGQENEFRFEGAVGRISQETEETILSKWKIGEYETEMKITSILAAVVGPLVGTIPIAIIGGLSRFSVGGSAVYQRVWSMMWLAFGFNVGPVACLLSESAMDPRPVLQGPPQIYLFGGLENKRMSFLLWVLYVAPAVGGLVVVGQMIIEYGVCLRISWPTPL